MCNKIIKIKKIVTLASDHTQWHIHTYSVRLLWTRDRPVAEASACTTHNIHRRQTSTPPAKFEPWTPSSERPYTYAVGRADTGVDNFRFSKQNVVCSAHISHAWLQSPPITSSFDSINLVTSDENTNYGGPNHAVFSSPLILTQIKSKRYPKHPAVRASKLDPCPFFPPSSQTVNSLRTVIH